MKPLMIELSRVEWYTPMTTHAFDVINGTAIIPVYGFLTKRAGPFSDFLGTTSYEEILENLHEALADPLVEKILLDVDSPGGEVNGVFDLCDEIYAARSAKQIEAIANDDAFSAAYAIASSASKLWISRTSGVGSIGVIATHIDQSSLDQIEGVKITPIFAGERKNDLTPHEPLSEAAMAAMRGEINRLYVMFVETVARNRGISAEQIRATEAAMFFGADAVNAGLADGFRQFDSLLSPPGNAAKSMFLTTNPRRMSMTHDELKQMQRIEEQALDAYLEDPPKKPDEDQEYDKDEPEFTARVNELVKLCKIAKRPELLADWIEKGMSVADAQESLLKEMETNDVDIISARTTKAPENPLIQAAKKRLKAS
jgi:signal peptide peptidase SppA